MRNDFYQNRNGDDRFRESGEGPGERWSADPRRGNSQGWSGAQHQEWQPGATRAGYAGSEYRGQSSYGGLSEHGSRGYESGARGFGGGEYGASDHGQGGTRGYPDYGQGNYGGSPGESDRGGYSAYGMSGGSRYSQENGPSRASSGSNGGQYLGWDRDYGRGDREFGGRQGMGAANQPGYGGAGQGYGGQRAGGEGYGGQYRGAYSSWDERESTGSGQGGYGAARGQGYGSQQGYGGANHSPTYGGYGNQSYGGQGYGGYGNQGYGDPTDAHQNRFGERSGPRRAQMPRGYARSDERLREDICERLAHRHDLDIADVSVHVQGGQVTLEGSVPERHMKHAIEDVADSVMGVHEVDNQVRVKRNWGHDGSGASTSGGVGASGSATKFGASNTSGATAGNQSHSGAAASGASGTGSSSLSGADTSNSDSSRKAK